MSSIKAKHVSPSETYMLIPSLVLNQTILGGNQFDHGPCALWHKKIHAIDPHLSFSSCWHNFSNSSAARQSPNIYRSPVSIFIWDVVVPTSKSSNFAAWDGLIHHLWNSDLLKSHEAAISSLERSLKSTPSSGRRCSSWAEVRVVPKISGIKCTEKASVRNENLWKMGSRSVSAQFTTSMCRSRKVKCKNICVWVYSAYWHSGSQIVQKCYILLL